MTDQTEREKFETWCRLPDIDLEIDKYISQNFREVRYRRRETTIAWACWQARAALDGGAVSGKNAKLADDLERDPAGIGTLDMGSVRQIIAALRALQQPSDERKFLTDFVQWLQPGMDFEITPEQIDAFLASRQEKKE